jgi:hypothetical protein
LRTFSSYTAQVRPSGVKESDGQLLFRGKRRAKFFQTEGLTNSTTIYFVDEDAESLPDWIAVLTGFDGPVGLCEFRFFGGLSIEETAEALKISPATVKRDWAFARAWLYHEMVAK